MCPDVDRLCYGVILFVQHIWLLILYSILWQSTRKLISTLFVKRLPLEHLIIGLSPLRIRLRCHHQINCYVCVKSRLRRNHRIVFTGWAFFLWKMILFSQRDDVCHPRFRSLTHVPLGPCTNAPLPYPLWCVVSSCSIHQPLAPHLIHPK
jgi:hypothetical protein